MPPVGGTEVAGTDWAGPWGHLLPVGAAVLRGGGGGGRAGGSVAVAVSLCTLGRGTPGVSLGVDEGKDEGFGCVSTLDPSRC